MRVSPSQLIPSQDFLKPTTIRFILLCIEQGDLAQLPPNPIVREGNNGELIAIDGHNLIAVKQYRNEDIEVHLARSADDGLPETSDGNAARNIDLMEKFDLVLAERARLADEGLNTFQELVNRNSELFIKQ